MTTIQLKELFTPDQMKHLIHLNLSTVGSPSKAFLAYINTQPDALEKCRTHNVLPEFLAYYIEFTLARYTSGSPSAL